jgi:hypothetical protein
MTSLTIVSDCSKEEIQSFADWLIDEHIKGFADKILINNKLYWEIWKKRSK